MSTCQDRGDNVYCKIPNTVLALEPFGSTIFKTIIYADDTTLLANLSDFFFKNTTKVNIKMLNNELNKIKLW